MTYCFKTCAGCKLNKIDGVKTWIEEEASKFDKVEVVYIDNLDPVVKFLDSNNNVVGSVVC